MILQKISRLLCQAYNLPGFSDVDRFLINAETLRHLSAEFPSLIQRRHAECLLIAESKESVELALYIDPAVTERLEGVDRHDVLNDQTIADFCVAAEGVSHLILTLWKVSHRLPMNQLEMEVQGEIDKFLLVYLMLHLQQRRSPGSLWRRLFANWSFSENLSAEEEERYRAAHALTAPYCATLQRTFINVDLFDRLLGELNRFYRLSLWRKFDHLRRCRRFRFA